MGINKLAGTPWHIEYLKAHSDDRRHKSWCEYYDNGLCIKKGYRKCSGSSFCEYYKISYKEKVENQHLKNTNKNSTNIFINSDQKSSVRIGDTIELYCTEDNDYSVITMKVANTPPIQEMCIGKRINEWFEFNGFHFKVNRFVKRGNR